MSDTRPLNSAERRALAYLNGIGRSGITADFVGDAVWPTRKGRITSSGGGGDYAAQMLLGRLRARGLVETVNAPGSSCWAITPRGRLAHQSLLLKANL